MGVRQEGGSSLACAFLLHQLRLAPKYTFWPWGDVESCVSSSSCRSNQKATAFDRFVQDNVSASASDLSTASAATSQNQGLVVP